MRNNKYYQREPPRDISREKKWCYIIRSNLGEMENEWNGGLNKLQREAATVSITLRHCTC